MITKITVDGFRSLTNFSMSLKPGLNMLVGPNGSGKTNIILFFEFLSHISSEPLGEAVSKCGGAGSIFQKSLEGDFKKEISASIQGDGFFVDNNIRKIIKYICSFTVAISEERDTIFFKSQRVQYYLGKRERYEVGRWDIDIICEWEDGQKYTTRLNRVDFRKISFPWYRFTQESSQTQSRELKVRNIAAHFGNSMDIDTNILVPLQRILRGIGGTLNDLVGGEAFNILPSAAREPEDSATPPGIRKDGSGLAATLYALKKAGRPKSAPFVRGAYFVPTYFGQHFRYPRRYAQTFRPTRRAFRQILEFARLVNDQILELDVVLDHSDNKLKIKVSMESQGGKIDLPFSLMSDGTVKWISLVTAIFTYHSIFAIEEPENFIHPLMQKEIVSIMRGASSEKAFKSFVLMTTHSETLLNAAEPEEVLVVSMVDGVTSAQRPRNRELLREEIARTGFGLGHYYLTGALDDA